jgi:hypothetical protein
MSKYRAMATFSEERPVEANTREEAELVGRGYYSENPIRLVESLRITVEEDSGSSAAAYQRLLVKAQCTADHCRGVTLNMLSADTRVDFLMAQLDYLFVRGYSREYVSQLVRENLRGQSIK